MTILMDTILRKKLVKKYTYTKKQKPKTTTHTLTNLCTQMFDTFPKTWTLIIYRCPTCDGGIDRVPPNEEYIIMFIEKYDLNHGFFCPKRNLSN